jgi:hypothetical protein
MLVVIFPSQRPIQAGFPQESLFGPTFNVYKNDIPSTEYGNNVAVAVYADDTIVRVQSGSLNIG